MALRIFFGIGLVLSMLFIPLWVTAVLVLFGMIYFRFYIEGIVALAILDLLYGVGAPRFFNVTFVTSIVAVFVFVIVEAAKKKLKFYSHD